MGCHCLLRYLVPILETVLSSGHEVKGIFAPLSKKYSLFLKYFCIGEEFQNNCAFFFKGYACMQFSRISPVIFFPLNNF